MFNNFPASCIDAASGVPTINCLPTLFHNAINGALLFAGIFALFLFAYGAIRLLMSAGDPKQLNSARTIMTYAIIGLIVVLTSFGIVFFISYLTKTTCITDLGKIVKGC